MIIFMFFLEKKCLFYFYFWIHILYPFPYPHLKLGWNGTSSARWFVMLMDN